MKYQYVLQATNEQGASVSFGGRTKKEALRKFDAEYGRSGFKISIFDHMENETIIKSTYR